jgi:hypothetical protein
MKGFKRPKARVIEDDALIPPENLVTPPQMYTHLLAAVAPFRYEQDAEPAGSLPKGTSVSLESTEGDSSWVVDSQGLRVLVRTKDLRAIG